MQWCDRQVGQHVRASPQAKRAAKVIGIGELGASALTAGVGDFTHQERPPIRRLAGCGAAPGLQRRQDPSGAHHKTWRRLPTYALLIQGAKAAVMSADKRDDPTSRWLVQLTARVGWQKACVAMANKNARILWAVITREEGFDPKHVSVSRRPSNRPEQPVSGYTNPRRLRGLTVAAIHDTRSTSQQVQLLPAKTCSRRYV